MADQRLKDPAALVPTAVKAAFTRACNDKSRDVKSGMLLPEFKKGRAKKKTAAAEGEGDEELDESEEDAAGAASDEEEEEAEPDIKKLNLLAKRGINISLKGGDTIAGAAKGKGKAASKPASGKQNAKR